MVWFKVLLPANAAQVSRIGADFDILLFAIRKSAVQSCKSCQKTDREFIGQD